MSLPQGLLPVMELPNKMFPTKLDMKNGSRAEKNGGRGINRN